MTGDISEVEITIPRLDVFCYDPIHSHVSCSVRSREQWQRELKFVFRLLALDGDYIAKVLISVPFVLFQRQLSSLCLFLISTECLGWQYC